MSTLKGKNIVIMGAGGGFGQAVSPILANHQANLALADLSEEALSSLAKSCASAGAAKITTAPVNVTDESSVKAFFDKVQSELGGADILLYLPGLSIASPVTDMSEADYDKIIDVNLKGLFFAAKHFVPLTKPERAPLLSFISSQAATRANPNAPVYCAAKAAVSMFGQGLALQLMQKDIRVTAFKPGPVDTKGFWGDRPVPRDKFMKPEDVAKVIEFTFCLPDHIVMHEVSFESFHFFKK